MDRAKIAISFDDGRRDNIAIISRLTDYEIPATLYVTTGYVDGSCPNDKLPTHKPAMTVDEVVHLFHNPLVEIGMHGDMHLNEDMDIKKCREKLIKWLELDSSHSFGFASPCTSFPIEEFKHSNDRLYTREITYLAMGMRILTNRNVRMICRKAGRVLHSGRLFREAYHDTMMDDCSDRVIYRVPILRETSVSQVISLLQQGVHEKKAITLMFHSIGTESIGDPWTWSNDKFEALLQYLCDARSNDSIELCTINNVYQVLNGRRIK